MCVAAIAQQGKIIPANYLRAMFATNPDGAGLAFINGTGKVEIRKGFMTADTFVKAYQDVVDGGFAAKNPVMVHVRAATLGKVDEGNCHPFAISKGKGAACHNGVLWGAYGGNGRAAEKSDTREYFERLDRALVYEDVLAAQRKLEDLIGYNKLILLYEGGKYIIMNEKSGDWKDGVWYSNSYWMARANSNADSLHPSRNNLR